ncbi:MAG: hypothetical protein GX207_09745, partial [Peptococcaceae bacterium]|nr:hypothetical protein [Peptococcaceae bacterium]
MYTYRPVTERMQRMRERIRDRVVVNTAERAVILTEAYKKYEKVDPMIKRPLTFKELCEKMTVFVEDDEIIVGGKGPHLFSSPAYPEWGVSDWILEPLDKGEWTLREDGLLHNPDDEPIRLAISPEDYQALKSVIGYWQ